MKTSILTFLFAVALGFNVCGADAQKGVYTLLSGGTTAIPNFTTNRYAVDGVTCFIGNPGTSTNLSIAVNGQKSIGFTFQFVASAVTTNGNTILKVFKSYNGGTIYEDNPSLTYTVANGGTGTYTTNGGFLVTNVTDLAFRIENTATNTTGYATNVHLSISLQ